jgi:peptidoglycan-associated lipoprotein
MNKIFLPVLLTLILSACGTTTGTQATVEDRTGDKAATATGTETAGVGAGGVSGTRARIRPALCRNATYFSTSTALW